VLDAVELEIRGRPTVTIVEERFERAARLHARVADMPLLPLIVESTPQGGAIQRGFDESSVDVAIHALTHKPEEPA
jgi:hypothetical protein